MTVVANSFVGVGKWHLINGTYASTVELYFFKWCQIIHWSWIFISIIEFHSQKVKTLYKPFSWRFSVFSFLPVAFIFCETVVIATFNKKTHAEWFVTLISSFIVSHWLQYTLKIGVYYEWHSIFTSKVFKL